MRRAQSSIRFSYTAGMSIAFFGDTVTFQSVVGQENRLAPFYEYAVIGFSGTGASGTFGVRFLWANPAMVQPTGAVAAGNVTVLNVGPAGLTGVGLSSGLFTFAKPSQLGVAGTTQATFVGIQDHFITPTLLEINRTGGVSTTGSMVISGFLMNPASI